jgi:hypothetical protein
MFFYLESFIWPDAILLLIRQRNNIKFCANLAKSATEALAMIIKALRAERMSCTLVFEWHALFRAHRKTRDR